MAAVHKDDGLKERGCRVMGKVTQKDGLAESRRAPELNC